MEFRLPAHPHTTEPLWASRSSIFLLKDLARTQHLKRKIQSAHRQLFLDPLLWLYKSKVLALFPSKSKIPALFFSAGWFHYKREVWQISQLRLICPDLCGTFMALCYSHNPSYVLVFQLILHVISEFLRHDGRLHVQSVSVRGRIYGKWL